MLKIDAVAHVLETEETWKYLEGTDQKFRPQIVVSTNSPSPDQYWLVDGTLSSVSEKITGANARRALQFVVDCKEIRVLCSSAYRVQFMKVLISGGAGKVG